MKLLQGIAQILKPRAFGKQMPRTGDGSPTLTADVVEAVLAGVVPAYKEASGMIVGNYSGPYINSLKEDLELESLPMPRELTAVALTRMVSIET